jgi:hypothetical protein
MLRELTGTSDHGARLRAERECTRALERGVDDVCGVPMDVDAVIK